MTGFSDPEIEQAAISALMQWPEPGFALADSRGIKTEHFQTPPNRVLFSCLSNYWRNGKPIHIVPFTAELRGLGLLDSIGGALYVTQTWINTCHFIAILEYYFDLIEEAYAKLLLTKACSSSLVEAETPGVEGEPLVTDTIHDLEAIPLPSRHKSARRSFAEAVDAKQKEIVSGKPAEDIVPTGLADLDQKSPLRQGDMPLIAGVRKAGKSILALNIALNIARRGIGVAYFSLEDSESKIMERVFANIKSVETVRSLPFNIIDDVSELGAIVALCRELKARKNIGLIVVDYGQLVVVPERKEANREQRVAEMSRTFRLLALQLKIPLILLSQLNDAGLTRESRALEQDATAMWRVDLVPKGKVPGVFELNQRKIWIPWQRNGESGVGCSIAFFGAEARVENLADDDF